MSYLVMLVEHKEKIGWCVSCGPGDVQQGIKKLLESYGRILDGVAVVTLRCDFDNARLISMHGGGFTVEIGLHKDDLHEFKSIAENFSGEIVLPDGGLKE